MSTNINDISKKAFIFIIQINIFLLLSASLVNNIFEEVELPQILPCPSLSDQLNVYFSDAGISVRNQQKLLDILVANGIEVSKNVY